MRPVRRLVAFGSFRVSRRCYHPLMPYDPELVAPMRKEMVALGARELTTPAEVDRFLSIAKDA